MRAPLNCAVIGLGRIGEIHAGNIAQHVAGARLVACADVREDVARAIGSRLNVPFASADYRAAIDRPDVDAVIVCTPTATHYDVIMHAAAHGRQVFTEKPIDQRLDRIDEINVEVARRGVAFMVGFQRRFDPDFARIRQIVRDGTIGDVHVVRISSRDAVPPHESFIPTSGGLFLDMTIHDFDVVRFITGAEVVSVRSTAAVLVDAMFEKYGDFDTAVVTLRLSNGALVAIDNSRKAIYGQDQRLEVFGSKGMVTAPSHTLDRVIYLDETGSHGARLKSFFPERYADAYRIEMQAFIDAVRAGGPMPVTGSDGRQAVAIALAARESAVHGREIEL